MDVRPADQYSRGSFPGAVNIPLDEFEERMESVDREKMVYVLCHTGDRSRDCVEKLSDAGYEAVNIEGGYRAYLRLSLSRFMENDAKEQKELKTKEIEHSIIKTFRKTVWRPFTKALNEYQLIQEGDKIAVCISGGKDSMLMAKLLQELKRHGKIHFELVFLVMNPGYNADNWKIIQDNAELLGIPLTVFESDIFDTVAEIENNPCYLCARMRRGYLYSHAKELGCNKIALGHHFDDVIETILMGMLYSGKVETMMPKLHSQNFEGMELIRPMYLIKESAIKAWRDTNGLHFIQCACRFTENCVSCGGGRGSKRDEMKELVAQFRNTSSVIERISLTVCGILIFVLLWDIIKMENTTISWMTTISVEIRALIRKKNDNSKIFICGREYTAQYYSGNSCLYVSGAGGVLKGGIHDLTGDS